MTSDVESNKKSKHTNYQQINIEKQACIYTWLLFGVLASSLGCNSSEAASPGGGEAEPCGDKTPVGDETGDVMVASALKNTHDSCYFIEENISYV